MKKLFIAAICALGALSMVSCINVRISEGLFSDQKTSLRGSANMSATEYTVPDFDTMVIELKADVEFRQSPGEPKVEIRTSENLIDHLHFAVDDGVLMLSLDDGIRASYDDMDIVVWGRSLRTVNIRGAADFDIPNGMITDRFELMVKGAGDCQLDGIDASEVLLIVQGAGDIEASDIQCENLTVSIQGAGDVSLEGRAENADFSIKGAGEIDARHLQMNGVKKSVSGIGEVMI